MLFVQRARHAAAALAKTPVHARTLASLPDQGPEIVSGLEPSKVEVGPAQKSNFVQHAVDAPHRSLRRRPRSSASTTRRASSPSAPAP